MNDGAKVRALLVTLDFPPTRGGIQTMAREILLRARRTDFHVIAPAHEQAARADAEFSVRVKRVRPFPAGRRGLAPALAWAAFRASRALRRPDVVLALHPLAAPGALFARVPTVVFTHGGELRSSRIRAVARKAFRRAECVLANSEFTRFEAVALGTDPMKVIVLPVGAPEPRAPAQHDVTSLRRRWGGRRVVLSVGRLVEHKGHDTMVRALARMPSDVRVVIVGEGPARATLQERARSARVADRVVFAGAVADDELHAYYAAADAFALLSRATAQGFEGGGIALLEACAYGLPIVAGRSGAIPETITDGVTGILVDPDDPGVVAASLERVLTDEPLAKRLGENARAMAAGERSWARFVERLEGILAGVKG